MLTPWSSQVDKYIRCGFIVGQNNIETDHFVPLTFVLFSTGFIQKIPNCISGRLYWVLNTFNKTQWAIHVLSLIAEKKDHWDFFLAEVNSSTLDQANLFSISSCWMCSGLNKVFPKCNLVSSNSLLSSSPGPTWNCLLNEKVCLTVN
jgi:hypothetical protein